MLRKFADSLEEGLRGNTLVFRSDLEKGNALSRVTGGEFVIFVPNIVDDKSLSGLVSKIFSAAQTALGEDARLTPISLKCGLASWPRDGSSPDELLQAANLASEYFEEGDQGSSANAAMSAVVRSREQARLESELQSALEREQFELYYQPKLCFADGSVAGFEALLRWRRSNNAYIPPTIFIPVAERTGLIVEFGKWVIKQAVAQIAAWRSTGVGHVPVAINLSPQQLVSSDIVSIIRDACEVNMVEPHFLQIEITESSFISDAESAAKLLQEIKNLGCSIALDDFGTGFSSLSYLRQLPLDVIKIDRSFTSTITADQQGHNLVTSIIGIAKSLGLKIVAEGVAAPIHWEMLSKWGCDEAQGYLISQPVPATNALDIWVNGKWDKRAYSFAMASTTRKQGMF